MRSLLGSVLVFTLGLSALGALARTLGSQQAIPERVQQLHLTGCAAPCWIGIEPGKTPINDAYRKLGSAFGLQDPGQLMPSESHFTGRIYNFLQFGSGNSILVHLGFVEGIMSEIRIPAAFAGTRSSPDMPTLGETVGVFGRPVCVQSVSRGVWSLIYVTPRGIVEVGFRDGERLGLTDSVYYLSLRQRGKLDEACEANRASSVPWLGFASQYLYQRRF